MVFWRFSVLTEHLFPLFASGEIGLLRQATENLEAVRIYPASTPLALECHRVLVEVAPQFDLGHRSQLLRIVVPIFSFELSNVHHQRHDCGGAKMHMVQVFEQMSGSDMLNLSVTELAEKFGCSTRHLNRLFHEHFGLSVAALRMEMRLLTAVSLLRDPDAKVTNVAAQCGFNHLGLFSTCFKRRFRLAPGEWRRTCADLCEPTEKLLAGDPNCRLQLIGLCPWCGDRKTPDYALLGNHGAGKTAAPRNGAKHLLSVAQAERKGNGQYP